MTKLFPILFLFPALAFAEWVVYEKEMADSEWQKQYVLESGRPRPEPDASCVIRLWGHIHSVRIVDMARGEATVYLCEEVNRARAARDRQKAEAAERAAEPEAPEARVKLW